MSRPLDNMTDVKDAKRLLILWVPASFGRWNRCEFGMCFGRLWIQRTSEFNNTLDTVKKRS